MSIKICRLQPGDEALALRIVRDLISIEEREGAEPTIGHLQRMLAQDTNYLIVATMEESPAGSIPLGFVRAYRMPDLCSDADMVYLYEIEVATAYRRQGIGKQMIELLKTLCLEDSADYIWVGTENANVAAKRLYESTGGICTEMDSCEFIYDLAK
jgi:ribosomal protein S18 acetylase RimI-like enzyme